MSPNEIPPALEAYHPGVVHVCTRCGCSVVAAVETPGEPTVPFVAPVSVLD